MVDRQLVRTRLHTAVLAGEVVSLEDVASAECHGCGWQADCSRCDAHMVYHRQASKLRCHHCGAERDVPATCPECGQADLRALGLGTQRVVDALGLAMWGLDKLVQEDEVARFLA